MYEKLEIKKRSLDSRSSLKAMRKEGHVPGVIYGKDIDSLAIQVPATRLQKFLHKSGRVFEVEVSGADTHLVHLDNIQWDHLGNHALHVAFHKLKKGQKTRVKVPFHWSGEAKGHKLDGGIVNHVYNEIEIEGLPKDIPDYIEVELQDLALNESICLKNISLPPNCEWTDDEDLVVVTCQPPRREEVVEAVTPEETPLVDDQQEAADSQEKDENSPEKAS